MGEAKRRHAGTDRREQVSLATLAAHLSLSQAAISRVLNGVPAAAAIPSTTQERIFAAAKLFNYRPNVLARSLRRGHSMTIGVLVPEISEGYATLVLAGLEQGLLMAGYAFFLCSHHHDMEVVATSQTMLSERAVDGIVAIDTTLVHIGLMPTVTVSCPDQGSTTTDIVLDHQRGATLAMEHLHALGHSRIAVIKGQQLSSDTEPRWRAIAAAADLLGIPLNPDTTTQLEEDAPTHEPGYLATRRLLDHGVRFTALFAFNDVSAIGAIRALREAGLRVPQDVSVVGFDDVQSAAFQNPALTTVRQPLHAMGLRAAQEIVHLVTNGERHQPVVLEPELIVRESTAQVCSDEAQHVRTTSGTTRQIQRC
ncbi:MAG: LacI family DNA-binding transcriptional regulator [Janthinobacterium lividum]